MDLKISVTDKPTDWVPGASGCIATSQYGEIWMVNLTEGERTHSRPLFIDRGGTITVIVDTDGNVVLETVLRPVCQPGQRITLPIKNPQGVLGNLSYESLEFPRGYARKLENAIETGLREAGEEVGLRSENVTDTMGLGEAFANGFNPQPNDFVLVIVDRSLILETSEMSRLREAIIGAEWASENEIWRLIEEGIIRDQQTLVAWAKYQAKKRQYPGLFQR